jgi:hypothetical protein
LFCKAECELCLENQIYPYFVLVMWLLINQIVNPPTSWIHADIIEIYRHFLHYVVVIFLKV